MEQQLPAWLANAVLAAGMTTVYNADDWDRIAQIAPIKKNGQEQEPPAVTH